MLNDYRVKEDGNITIMFLALSLCISLILVLAIDLGTALFQKSTQENDLAIACDEVESSAFGLSVKNSNNPELSIAQKIVEDLRDNGTQAKAHIYVYEAAKSDVPTNKRAIAYYVVLEGKYKPFFVGNLTGDITVANAKSGFLIPYSTEVAWRPATTQPGEYIAQEGKTSVTRVSKTLNSMPKQLQETLSQAIEEAHNS